MCDAARHEKNQETTLSRNKQDNGLSFTAAHRAGELCNASGLEIRAKFGRALKRPIPVAADARLVAAGPCAARLELDAGACPVCDSSAAPHTHGNGSALRLPQPYTILAVQESTGFSGPELLRLRRLGFRIVAFCEFAATAEDPDEPSHLLGAGEEKADETTQREQFLRHGHVVKVTALELDFCSLCKN